MFWIGVDLDGTLAVDDGWRGPDHIGDPIPAMVERVKLWLARGQEVRIFTARVDGGAFARAVGHPDGEKMRDVAAIRACIEAWCVKHIGAVLPITNVKDSAMLELWDDRARQVEHNTGKAVKNG